jgi:hypothetical protein
MSQEAEVSQQKQICFNISLAGFAKVFTEMPIPSMNACAHVSIFYI